MDDNAKTPINSGQGSPVIPYHILNTAERLAEVGMPQFWKNESVLIEGIRSTYVDIYVNTCWEIATKLNVKAEQNAQDSVS